MTKSSSQAGLSPDKKRLWFSLRHQVPVTVRGEAFTDTGEIDGASWTGVVVGILQEPAILLEQADGKRVMLPMRFSATLAIDSEEEAQTREGRLENQ